MDLLSLRNINVFCFNSKINFLNYISNKKNILVAINAEKLLKNDPKLKNIVNNHIGYADGVGAVLALKQKGFLDAVKIPGSEFWLDIIENFNNEKSFYFIGSSDEVINKTVDKLKNDFPNIKIKGYRNGFIKNEQDFENTCEDIISKKPDVIFVAQGSPRQEYTMDKMYQKYPALYMGLGGSFDIYSGLKQRAPEFYLKNNLEWFYRLLKEPTRISRQFVLLKFIVLLFLKKI